MQFYGYKTALGLTMKTPSAGGLAIFYNFQKNLLQTAPNSKAPEHGLLLETRLIKKIL
jgi:hypothetical protein